MKKLIINACIILICCLWTSATLLSAQDIYESNNTIENAATIACGGNYEAFIQFEEDQDWYQVNVSAAGTLSASLSSVPSFLDLNLEIYQIVNGIAKRIADDDDTNAGGGQALIATAFINPGTYYILVHDEDDNSSSELESYILTLVCTPDGLEVNQTIDEAMPISLDTCFSATIYGENECYTNSNEGDDDQEWYRVMLTEPGYLKVTTTGVPASMDLNLEIYAYESGFQTRIADDDDTNAGGGQNLTSVAYLEPGDYYIHIEDEDHNFTSSEDFLVCISFLPDDVEINQTIELAAPIPRDTCFDSRIYGENENFTNSTDGDDDQDWFVIETNASGYLETTLFSVPANLDLNLEIFQIKDNIPVRIADDDDTNAGGGQVMTAVAFVDPGVYYIHIEDEDHNATNEETYSFCVSFVEDDLEINQTIELAKPIPRDTCFESRIYGENECFENSTDGDDDQDWYRVNITESGRLKAVLSMVPANLDLNLEIFQIKDNIPVRISDDDDTNSGGGQALTTVAYINPGIYYVHIEDEDQNATNDELFNFCLSFFPDESEINQTIELASFLPLDTCIQNQIYGENECYNTSNEGDDDQNWFQFEAPQTCSLQILITQVPNPLDLNLELYQLSDNQEVLIADDGDSNAGGGQDLEILVPELAPGTYYIHIEDEDHNATDESFFSLCLSCDFMIPVSELELNKIEVYPNPARAHLYVKGLDAPFNLRVHTSDGRLVKDVFTDKEEINISDLGQGLYFLTFLSDGKYFYEKILIER